MEIVNTTPYRFHGFDFSVGPKHPGLSLIVKGTFDLRMDEPAAARPEKKQDPIKGDEMYMDDIGRSLSYATDLVPIKTRGEVMMIGHCRPDAGRQRTACDVSLELGPIEKTLRVSGDRRWGAGGEPTLAQHFDVLPLRWEYTFGALSHSGNPLGRGIDAFPDPETGKEATHLPNIEYPNARMKTPADRPPPACFGPISPAWSPRLERVGTRDARWAAFRAPLPPVDFDARVHNAAPDDQQLDEGVYFRGDETFTLGHVHPELPSFTGALPGKRIRVFVALRAMGEKPRRFVEIEMRLDTVFIDADDSKLVLVWRRPFAVVAPGHPEIEAVYIAEERLADEPLPLEVHQAKYKELRPDRPSEADEMQAEIDAQMAEADKMLEGGGIDPKTRAEFRSKKEPKGALDVLMRVAQEKIRELEAMTAKLKK